MKTKHTKQLSTINSQPSTKSGLPSQSEQLSTEQNKTTNTQKQVAPAEGQTLDPRPSTLDTPPRALPYVNYKLRDENRALPTDRVLTLLQRWMPRQYQLAEVVGKWVWITFPEQPEETVRGQLSQFGFHWNNSRKCWQHPCGQFATEGSGQDPRVKYGSRMITSPAA